MKYRTLGKDLKVSEVGLGCMGFSNAYGTPTEKQEAIQRIWQAVEMGYPTWWYDMPQVLYSFFDEYDFSGKTIIPFNVHNGSSFSGTIDTIQELEPDADVIIDGFTVNERNVPDAQGDIYDWLNGLGY